MIPFRGGVGVTYLEEIRSKYLRPERLAVPADLPPFCDSVFVIFRGLADCPGFVCRHFSVTPEGLEPLDSVCAGTMGYVRAMVPEGSSLLRSPAAKHPKAYQIWIPPLGYGRNRPHREPA